MAIIRKIICPHCGNSWSKPGMRIHEIEFWCNKCHKKFTTGEMIMALNIWECGKCDNRWQTNSKNRKCPECNNCIGNKIIHKLESAFPPDPVPLNLGGYKTPPGATDKVVTPPSEVTIHETPEAQEINRLVNEGLIDPTLKKELPVSPLPPEIPRLLQLKWKLENWFKSNPATSIFFIVIGIIGVLLISGTAVTKITKYQRTKRLIKVKKDAKETKERHRRMLNPNPYETHFLTERAYKELKDNHLESLMRSRSAQQSAASLKISRNKRIKEIKALEDRIIRLEQRVRETEEYYRRKNK